MYKKSSISIKEWGSTYTIIEKSKETKEQVEIKNETKAIELAVLNTIIECEVGIFSEDELKVQLEKKRVKVTDKNLKKISNGYTFIGATIFIIAIFTGDDNYGSHSGF